MTHANAPSTSLFRRHPVALAACLGAALALGACGGGGGGSSSNSTASTPAAAVISTVSTASTVPAQLSGVAAFGAPLAGATLKVIDAKGRAVGGGSTNQADGSYTLTLNTAAPTMPLLVQAAGFDATGLPLLLHAAVATLPTTATAATGTTAGTTTTGTTTTTTTPTGTTTTTTTPSIVLNITPLTDAVVALTLGTEPRKVFAQPTAYAMQLAALGTAATLTAASDFVKTLVKTNLTDAKVTNTTTLDLFADSSFAAAKAGVDLALETLAIAYGSSTAKREQLQLANKLGSKAIEVTVDLANAATELAKASGAAPATAITSTLKTTTSPTTVVTRLPALDTLAVAVNTAVAAGGSGSLVTALASGYSRHNGRDATMLAALVNTWALQGTQLGRLQVTGCADLPATSTSTGTSSTTSTNTTATACTKVAVAARLTDTAGNQTGSFSDVVTYNSTTLKWTLVGNGLPALVTTRAEAWLALNADGSKTSGLTGNQSNPRTGIALGVHNTTGSSVGVTSATVLTPSNYVLSLVNCAQSWLCITPVSGATSTVASASPTDQAVFQGTSVWMGVADTAAGASYAFTLAPYLTTSGTTTATTSITLPVALRNGFVDAPADARFPVLDGVKPDAPLSGATLLFGSTLSWATWAAANPDMRLTTVRLVLSDGTAGSTPLLFEARPARWQSTTLDWSAVTLPGDYNLASLTLWLVAIDSSGREVVTGYNVVAAP